ncbi:hypothetical protein A2630_00860 [Candidatus Woesebacteria bacterium RIFCSPHIGHO2_01_FULL_44_10]|uniref:DUF4446 domain-containing protein n=1 Tax=Candidatus Woesebacteria bacterium RIFCSPLOWO2_01_FULL_44_14 TaxID=1802525 RepID=A0A1F8C2Y0_9BACT|nr:MAG: hypothetical protein A2630_00860 [Candidatus Woesebacteria bacterium RIFCSPHIGHO2_01_FULL_44_10]OGM54328.1 MAG: hypothetical protein A3F62_01065 [Candidatus Woesebacteria bacterium RIFCSPHIGHO2_12_FULL_44_11]OGM70229.1 MAG: hypothetical protein A2975_04115 [Candidatus Woesebacteria bacterium RIFCSPLOWO2_01_FULL_44_14]
MQTQTIVILLILVGAWLLVLTAFVYLTVRHYRRLVKDAKEPDLKRVLDKMLSQTDTNSRDIAVIGRQIKNLEEEGKLHIQKVGLVRFNPFSETGGDHSFSLALLDAIDTGLVITGLHTRERTRVYMKPIKKGKSNLDLSKEELKAISQAT